MSDKYLGIAGYVYTRDNPIVFVDPDGKDWILVTAGKTYWYGGKTGDKANLIAAYKSTSGYKGNDVKGKHWNLQKGKYQNVRNAGPTPEGRYYINLKPDPNRVASADPQTGELKRNPEGGIEKIPDFVENPNREGYGWTYADWGENRAHLEPVDVTGAKPEERDNNSYYLHDSEKGYTHGCTEVDGDLFNKLKEYREAGNEKIDVIVQYPNGEHSTNGGTEKSKTVE